MLKVFTDDDAHKYVCHFTAPDTFLTHIFPTFRLRMSRFLNVNDPRESRQWTCTLMVPDELIGQDWDIVALSDRFTAFMKANAKLLCVTRDDPGLDPDRVDHLYGRAYAHPSMWDRYAGGHTGVCLMLDVDRLNDAVAQAAVGHGELYRMGVSYADQPPAEHHAYTLWAGEIFERGEEAVFAEHQRTHHGALYFWKSKDWAAEYEYRWVLLDSGGDEVYVDITDALSGVVFGDRFPAATADMVANTLAGRNITLSRLHYRNGHPIVLPRDPQPTG